MSEGYVTMAFGKEHYFKQAWLLALSVRLRDSKRSISLLYDGDVPDKYKPAFDKLIPMDKPLLRGYMDKMRFYEKSPYDKTLYIDSDCLLVKEDIDQWWEKLKGIPFTVTGDVKKSGKWGSWDSISDICNKFGVPYVVTMNGGVIYTEKCELTAKFFDFVFQLYEKNREQASWVVESVKGYNDEPLMAIAMGKFGFLPLKEQFDRKGRKLCLQRSTLNTMDWNISLPRKTCIFFKAGRTVSPTILHLCAYSRYPRLKDIIEDQYRWLEKNHGKSNKI